MTADAKNTGWGSVGSTQEEVGAIVRANIDDKKISGNDRAVAWDGQTRSGQGLQNQINSIEDSKVQAVCSLLHDQKSEAR